MGGKDVNGQQHLDSNKLCIISITYRQTDRERERERKREREAI